MGILVDEERAPVLLLAGGGIDSTACAELLAADGFAVRAVHIDYGQPAASDEWNAVRGIAEYFRLEHRQVRVQSDSKFRGGLVEGRNALFVFLGLVNRRVDEHLICLGIHAGTPFVDCGAPFINQLNELMLLSTDGKVRLITPLLELSKAEVVRHCRERGIPLKKTYSCQKGGRPCEECLSCLDRRALQC